MYLKQNKANCQNFKHAFPPSTNTHQGLNYVKYASEEIVKIKIHSYLTAKIMITCADWRQVKPNL